MVDFDAIIREVNERRGLAFKAFEVPADDSASIAAMFVGDLSPYGTVFIRFRHSFPYCLPIITMKDRFPRRLHVERNGNICLMHPSSLLIDVSKPAQLVIDCLEKAEQVLGLAIGTPEYETELKKEFFSYWGQEEEDYHYCSTLSLTKISSVTELPLFSIGRNLLLCDSKEDATQFICKDFGPATCNEVGLNAVILRLKEDAVLPLPFHAYTWAGVLNYIRNNCTNETYHSFLGVISKPVKRYALRVCLILPDSTGDILFGFEAYFCNPHKLPIKVSQSRHVFNINIRRFDYDFLLTRGGAMFSLKEKRILLLGCGSVGGYLANNLCQLGVTQLDLMDNDIFLESNVYRHFMGFDAIRQSPNFKSDLLRNVLNEKYLDLDIDSMNYKDRSVQTIILDEPQKLAQYDLVISALGEPTLNLAISDILVEQKIRTPFIVCFNEPYGIGGHVITTNISNDSCLRCLYTDVSEGSMCSFRASLVMPGQTFEKTLSGCSGTFVPYSALDSQQTAIHAARKAIDVLTGALRQNDLFTWRGEAPLIESQGYQVSDFYRLPLIAAPLENPGCPTCARRRSAS